MAGVGHAINESGPAVAGQVVQLWPLSRFRPYDRNPRKNDHAVERVAAAIKEFGFKVPVLARSSGELVDGHLRLKAAAFLGLESIPVLLADDLTDAQVRAFRISVNRMAELAEWDTDLLASELDELAALDVPVEMAGWTGAELEKLEVPMAQPEPLADPEEVPEVKPVVTTRPGDLWLLGGHRLLCGDSTKAEDVARVMNGEKADLLFTDPPYGVAYKDSLGRRVLNDELESAQLQEFLTAAFSAAAENASVDAAWFVWHASRYQREFENALNSCGIQVRQQIIWVKGAGVEASAQVHAPAIGHAHFRWLHEPCFYAARGQPFNAGDRKTTTVWTVTRPTTGTVHPTQKPIALIEIALLNCTRASSVVLDSFGGSGSTLIACDGLSRVARLLELDHGYCDVIVRRWEGVTGKQATLESTGETFATVAARRAQESA